MWYDIKYSENLKYFWWAMNWLICLCVRLLWWYMLPNDMTALSQCWLTLMTHTDQWTGCFLSMLMLTDKMTALFQCLFSLMTRVDQWTGCSLSVFVYFNNSCWPMNWLLSFSVCFLWWLMLTNELAALFQCSFPLMTHVDQWTGCSLSVFVLAVFVSPDDSCWPVN